MKDVLYHKLQATFSPVHLEVTDVSSHHAGHPQAPAGGNSHFDAVIVSDAFSGLSKIDRQRWVYRVVADEFRNGPLHALSLRTLTPEEWQKEQKDTAPSDVSG